LYADFRMRVDDNFPVHDNAFREPAILAATQQMKFKRSGNQLVT
jgi:hypothetical protein